MIDTWNRWGAILMDGAAGGVLGVLGAFFAAFWVFNRQSKHDRALARLERRMNSVVIIHTILIDVMTTLMDSTQKLDLAGVAHDNNISQAKLMQVLVPSHPVSPELFHHVVEALNALTSSRSEAENADDGQDVLQIYIEGFEVVIAKIGDASAHVGVLLERDGDLTTPRVKQGWLQWMKAKFARD